MALFPYLSHLLSLLWLASQFGTSVGAKTLTLKQAVLVSGVQGNHDWQLVIALPCFLTALSLWFCPPYPQICLGRWPTIQAFPISSHPSPSTCCLPAACRCSHIVSSAAFIRPHCRPPLVPQNVSSCPPYVCPQIAVVFEFVGAMVLGRVSTATISGGIAGGPCC